MTAPRQSTHRSVCSGLLLLVALAASAQAQRAPSEAVVKAAYLFRFAGYVEWPEQAVAARPFVIDVVGDPDVARELRHLIPGHPIHNSVVEVREITRAQEAQGAQMVYVASDHDDFLRGLGPIGTRSSLVVTAEEQGLDLGGVLNFVTIDKRVRFEVSLTAAERAQLKISSDLLSVAVRVHGGRRQSDAKCIPFAVPDDADAMCSIRQAMRQPLAQ